MTTGGSVLHSNIATLQIPRVIASILTLSPAPVPTWAFVADTTTASLFF